MDSSPVRLIATAVCLIAFLATSAVPVRASSLPAPVVQGQVKDTANRPVKGFDVILTNKKTGAVEHKRTNRMGRFKIRHDRCHLMTLEINPPVTSGLARAFIDNVPGDKRRSYVIHLHNGFQVSGRVTHGGQGVRDLTVKIFPKHLPTDDGPDNVHGTASCSTGKEGEFSCILTPGVKRLVVINDVYADLKRQIEKEVTVTGKHELEDIELPAAGGKLK